MFVDDMDAHKDRRLDLADELDIKRVKTVWKFIQVLNWGPENFKNIFISIKRCIFSNSVSYPIIFTTITFIIFCKTTTYLSLFFY